MIISIVVPTKNSEKYLRQCLDSIENTEVYDFECIIVDGGSTDKTLDIINDYLQDHRFKLIQGKDKNEPDAINKGFMVAKGDVLAWLDSDDYYLENTLFTVNKAFQNQNVSWLYGKYQVVDNQGKQVNQRMTQAKEKFQKHYAYNTLRLFDYIPQPSTFFRKEMIKEFGYLNVNEPIVFDYEYWLRIGQKYNPLFINKYLSCWRLQENGSSVSNVLQAVQDSKRISMQYGGWGFVQDLAGWVMKKNLRNVKPD